MVSWSWLANNFYSFFYEKLPTKGELLFNDKSSPFGWITSWFPKLIIFSALLSFYDKEGRYFTKHHHHLRVEGGHLQAVEQQIFASHFKSPFLDIWFSKGNVHVLRHVGWVIFCLELGRDVGGGAEVLEGSHLFEETHDG